MHRTISRQENMTYSSPQRADTLFPSITPKECTDGRTEYAGVTTKISRVDSLPIYLSYGAPLLSFCSSTAR